MMRRRLAAGGAVLGSTAVLGVPLGLLWWLLAPRPRVTVGRKGTVLPYPVSETNFAVDGYFTLIMTVAGLVVGYGVYMLQYRIAARDATDLRLVCLLAVASGGLLGSVAAWQTGTMIDAGGFQRAIEAASPGDVIRSGLTLHALSALVAWPFVAVLQYGLFDAVSLWRGDLPGQRRSGAADDDGDPGEESAEPRTHGPPKDMRSPDDSDPGPGGD